MSHWTYVEQQKAVEAYLNMLMSENNEVAYNKAAINRQLREGVLSMRSKSSVEYRMQNISAVLEEMNMKYIAGYKPARNVGQQVRGELISLLKKLMPQELNNTSFSTNSEQAIPSLLTQIGRSKPIGNKYPVINNIQITTHVRDPYVKAWVLEQANGECESCDKSAPFINDSGKPYLEVHHMKPLAEGGSDTVDNAVALCPNCHRQCHHSQNRVEFVKEIYNRIERLIIE